MKEEEAKQGIEARSHRLAEQSSHSKLAQVLPTGDGIRQRRVRSNAPGEHIRLYHHPAIKTTTL